MQVAAKNILLQGIDRDVPDIYCKRFSLYGVGKSARDSNPNLSSMHGSLETMYKFMDADLRLSQPPEGIHSEWTGWITA